MIIEIANYISFEINDVQISILNGIEPIVLRDMTRKNLEKLND